MTRTNSVKLQSPSPVVRFFLTLLVVMPLCLGVWWFLLRDYLVMLLQFGADQIARQLWADMVLAIDDGTDARSGAIVWVVKTSLSPISDPSQLHAILVSTSRFTISYPLLWGLVIATPNNNKDRQLALSTLLMVPITLLIALLIVQFKLALSINHQAIVADFPTGDYLLALPYNELSYYLTAVGRQLGMLVLPTLSPLLVWGLFNRNFIRSVIFEGLLSRSTQLNLKSDGRGAGV